MLYQEKIFSELNTWQKQMLKKPTIINYLQKTIQTKINNWIPEKVHNAITATLKQLIKAIIFGAKYSSVKLLTEPNTMEEKELAVIKRIEIYKTTAAVEGGIIGTGGILLGLAEFPILIGIKFKLLFDIASIYGYDVKDYKERIYILHIFELAFSSHEHRKNVYVKMLDWDIKKEELPDDINQFDWRNFQQEYRDYIDIAKLVQLIPVIGAPVGAIVNYKLIKKLGSTAMNAYRLRLK